MIPIARLCMEHMRVFPCPSGTGNTLRVPWVIRQLAQISITRFWVELGQVAVSMFHPLLALTLSVWRRRRGCTWCSRCQWALLRGTITERLSRSHRDFMAPRALPDAIVLARHAFLRPRDKRSDRPYAEKRPQEVSSGISRAGDQQPGGQQLRRT